MKLPRWNKTETELTTERLEKLRDNLLQFQDAYSDPADKENYDIFVDALHVLDEVAAFRKASENPVASCWVKDSKLERSQLIRYADLNYPDGEIDLYTAPVLSRQLEFPEEVPATLRDEIIDLCDGYEIGDVGAQEIWNACRSEMLKNDKFVSTEGA